MSLPGSDDVIRIPGAGPAWGAPPAVRAPAPARCAAARRSFTWWSAAPGRARSTRRCSRRRAAWAWRCASTIASRRRPGAGDALAVGYHFDPAMPEGFWVICDDDLAPKGYAYLLVMRGKGTLMSCMFLGFKQERRYVERTVEAFRRLVGLEMKNPRLHGGVGNFRLPASALAGTHPVAGEEAGVRS